MNLDLKTYFAKKKEVIDIAMRQNWISAELIKPKTLFKAMEYSLFAPGKRIRPILVFASAEALGVSEKDVVPIAAALEMIHVFSLIHDDLPAMDNDDLRRGQPTNHKVFGEAMSILAGDALLSHAFIPLGELDSNKYPAKNIISLIHSFAQLTGIPGMVAGQVMDLQSEDKKISLDQLVELHQHKTGALIRLAVTSPAILNGEPEAKLNNLCEYGEAIGLAFQIIDDILDIEGGEELGKDIGSDVEKGKSTYPSLLGLDGAKKEAQKMLDKAMSALSDFDEKADALRQIAKFIVERRY